MGIILNFEINSNFEDDFYMVDLDLRSVPDLDLRSLHDLDLKDQSRMQDHFNSRLGIHLIHSAKEYIQYQLSNIS